MDSDPVQSSPTAAPETLSAADVASMRCPDFHSVLPTYHGNGPAIIPVLEYTCEDLMHNNKLVSFKALPPHWLLNISYTSLWLPSATSSAAYSVKPGMVHTVDGQSVLRPSHQDAGALYRTIKDSVPSNDGSPYNTLQDRFRVVKIRVLM
jgi:hypothetical protein